MFRSLLLTVSLFTSLALAETHITKFEAQYMVPDEVGNPTPLATRTFTVDYFIIQEEGKADQTIFRMPQDLTGRKVLVDLSVTEKTTGADGVVVKKLTGPLGEAICRGPWARMQCAYHFKNLQLDKMETLNYLGSKYSLESWEFWDASRRARIFRCDPAGEIQTERATPNLAEVNSCTDT
jgi:hypothetical protein